MQASDLAFLFREDLVEFGIPPQDAQRIMRGVHPLGTVRPDNPNLCSLSTGEVRLIDRQQRQLPWIIQNRTLTQRTPSVPLAGLGVRDPTLEEEDTYDWVVSDERREREERWIAYTEVRHPAARSSDEPPPSHAESVDSSSAQVSDSVSEPDAAAMAGHGDIWFEDYEGYAEYAMAMQAVWNEDDRDPDIGGGSSSNLQLHPPSHAESVVFPISTGRPPFTGYLQCATSEVRFPCRMQCATSEVRFPCRMQCATSEVRFPCRMQCATSEVRSQYVCGCVECKFKPRWT